MTYQPPAAPPQQWQPVPQRSNTALVAVVSVLAVLVVVFMAFAAYLLLSKDGGQSTNATETKVIAPPAADVKPAAPAPARQAPVQQARFLPTGPVVEILLQHSLQMCTPHTCQTTTTLVPSMPAFVPIAQ
ncbi:hypothetical protein ACQX25_03655 [Corynebacterium diphtheriae]|uniref:hypothetical protein n=1 Tax=Corynebacterium diphtheriae TaxID=1717 RepID=UPI0002E31A42|nr:hypothetical protein [Corynebacterium diphtheriae]CAB0723191.1 hypothetical protein FRC0088_00737 [Corynebacterium diphtheriae]